MPSGGSPGTPKRETIAGSDTYATLKYAEARPIPTNLTGTTHPNAKSSRHGLPRASHSSLNNSQIYFKAFRDSSLSEAI